MNLNVVNPWFPLRVEDDRLSHGKILPCQHQDTCPLNYIQHTFFNQHCILCYSPFPASAAEKNLDPSVQASGDVSSLRLLLWSMQETEEEEIFFSPQSGPHS